MHKAMLPHRRTFPLFVRKVLGCEPQTRSSHLTVKQIEQLQNELVRMKSFTRQTASMITICDTIWAR